MVRFAGRPLCRRRARGRCAASLPAAAPVEYPEVGVYHPRLTAAHQPTSSRTCPRATRGTRRAPSACCSCAPTCWPANTAPLRRRDRRARGARPEGGPGLRQRPRRAPGDRALLHATTASPTVDAVVSLTGFSLVGGPAYNDARPRPRTAGRGSTCPNRRPCRSSSRRSSNGKRSDRGLTAGRDDDDGRDPGARRRHRPDASSAAAPRRARQPTARSDMQAAPGAASTCWPRRVARWSRCAAPSAPSARSRSCCSTSRPTPARPAPPPTSRCSNRCINTLTG